MSKPSYELAHCIVCGHADARLIADAGDLRGEMEDLWEHHQRRLRPDTPPSRLMDRTTFSQAPAFRLVRCRECGLVYRNPAEREHELAEIYERDAPAPDLLLSLHRAQLATSRRQASALRRVLGGSGAGLEVGSYAGAFLAAARDAGLRFEGLDVNAFVNAFARSLGFTAHDGDLIAFAAAENRTFDAIAIWNAFDQLADPRGTLHAARVLLRSGGVLALRVPNGAFYARWRKRLTRANPIARAWARSALAQNNLLTFPYRWGFTPSSLAQLLSSCGFRVTATRGDVLVPVSDEWTRRWARVEETVVKRVLALPGRLDAARAPWLETIARRET